MMDATKIFQVNNNVLSLAKKLDQSLKKSGSWRVYSVNDQKPAMSFELIPYEDCPACGKQEKFNCDEIKHLYERLLDKVRKPKLKALKQQVF